MNSHISGAAFGSATICTAVLAAAVLLGSPVRAFIGGVGRFGGAYRAGGYGRVGGAGFRFGGDGFAGGNPDHTSWSQSRESAYSTNQTARYNEINSLNQSRYNEAQSMQNEHYQNESALSHQQYNQVSNLQSNSHGYWDPYRGCCDSYGGSAAGAAAAGMVGGMAMGAAMESATAPRQTTTIVENAAPSEPLPAGTTVPVLPSGATVTQVNGMDYYYSNGTYFRPVFNGSQVVYVAMAR